MRFKMSIEKIISEYKMDNLVLVPKNNSLKEELSRNLRSAGTYGKNLKILEFRGEDISGIVEDLYFDKRIKAVGITGDDLYDEYQVKTPNSLVDILDTLDWDDETARFRRPALCLIGRAGEEIIKNPIVAVNVKYLETSRKGLEEIGLISTLKVYNGNTEATVSNGINDLCVDIVYSGKTLEKEGLEIKEMIRFSDIVVIGVNEKSPLGIKRDYETVFDRVKNPKPDSYTSKLASDQNKAIKKLGEEFSEFQRACILYGMTGDIEREKKDVALEFQQLFYTMSINAARCGLDFCDISKAFYAALKRD